MAKRIILLLSFITLNVVAFSQQKNRYIKVETPQGWCVVKLYNETPVHRDNFIKLTKAGYFNKTTFNRILKNFVVQGCDQDSLYEKGKKLNPEQKWLPAELVPALFHHRGAVAMGRDDNPSQSSFSTQFYIVDGKTWTDDQLDMVEQKYHYHFTPEQRNVYRTVGGTPFLDGHYTVFGEIVKGMSLIDKITAVNVDKNGNPDNTVWMKVTVLSPGQTKAVLKN